MANNRFLFCFGLAAAYFFSNVAGLYASESNLWTVRRAALDKRRTALARSPIAIGVGPNRNELLLPSVSLPSALHQPSGTVGSIPLSTTHAFGYLPSVVSGYGDIRRVHLAAGRGRPAVVHLQDVHEVEEVQRNLAGMVGGLLASGRVGVVGLEGATGAFRLEPYRSGPPDIVSALAKEFVHLGYLTGPESAAITAVRAPLLWGVETRALYKKNVDALGDAETKRPVLAERIRTLSAAADGLRDTLYPAGLRALDDRRLAHLAGRASLGQYVIALWDTPVDKGRFVNTARFVGVLEAEKKIDFRAAEAQRQALIRVLTGRISAGELDRLIKESLRFRSDTLSPDLYYGFLDGFCRQQRIRLVDYPALNSYISYVLSAHAIDRERLLEELDELEEAAIASLATTASAASLARARRGLALLVKLSRHELTPKEWAAYRKDRNSVLELPGTLAALGAHGPGGRLSEELLAPFEQFCEAALERNRALVDNLLEKMRTEKADTGVLVAGGFHTAGLTEILGEKGVSFAVVGPRLSRTPETSRPLDVFSRAPLPIEILLAGEVINLAYAPLAQSGGTVPDSPSGLTRQENSQVLWNMLLEFLKRVRMGDRNINYSREEKWPILFTGIRSMLAQVTKVAGSKYAVRLKVKRGEENRDMLLVAMESNLKKDPLQGQVYQGKFEFDGSVVMVRVCKIGGTFLSSARNFRLALRALSWIKILSATLATYFRTNPKAWFHGWGMIEFRSNQSVLKGKLLWVWFLGAMALACLIWWGNMVWAGPISSFTMAGGFLSMIPFLVDLRDQSRLPARVVFLDFGSMLHKNGVGRGFSLNNEVERAVRDFLIASRPDGAEIVLLSTKADERILELIQPFLNSLDSQDKNRVFIRGRAGAGVLGDLIDARINEDHMSGPRIFKVIEHTVRNMAIKSGEEAGEGETPLFQPVNDDDLPSDFPHPDMKVWRLNHAYGPLWIALPEGVSPENSEAQISQGFCRSFSIGFHDWAKKDPSGADHREIFFHEFRKWFPHVVVTMDGESTVNVSMVDKGDLIRERYLKEGVPAREIVVVGDDPALIGDSAGLGGVLVMAAGGKPGVDEVSKFAVPVPGGPAGVVEVLESETQLRRKRGQADLHKMAPVAKVREFRQRMLKVSSQEMELTKRSGDDVGSTREDQRRWMASAIQAWAELEMGWELGKMNEANRAAFEGKIWDITADVYRRITSRSGSFVNLRGLLGNAMMQLDFFYHNGLHEPGVSVSASPTESGRERIGRSLQRFSDLGLFVHPGPDGEPLTVHVSLNAVDAVWGDHVPLRWPDTISEDGKKIYVRIEIPRDVFPGSSRGWMKTTQEEQKEIARRHIEIIEEALPELRHPGRLRDWWVAEVKESYGMELPTSLELTREGVLPWENHANWVRGAAVRDTSISPRTDLESVFPSQWANGPKRGSVRVSLSVLHEELREIVSSALFVSPLNNSLSIDLVYDDQGRWIGLFPASGMKNITGRYFRIADYDLPVGELMGGTATDRERILQAFKKRSVEVDEILAGYQNKNWSQRRLIPGDFPGEYRPAYALVVRLQDDSGTSYDQWVPFDPFNVTEALILLERPGVVVPVFPTVIHPAYDYYGHRLSDRALHHVQRDQEGVRVEENGVGVLAARLAERTNTTVSVISTNPLARANQQLTGRLLGVDLQTSGRNTSLNLWLRLTLLVTRMFRKMKDIVLLERSSSARRSTLDPRYPGALLADLDLSLAPDSRLARDVRGWGALNMIENVSVQSDEILGGFQIRVVGPQVPRGSTSIRYLSSLPWESRSVAMESTSEGPVLYVARGAWGEDGSEDRANAVRALQAQALMYTHLVVNQDIDHLKSLAQNSERFVSWLDAKVREIKWPYGVSPSLGRRSMSVPLNPRVEGEVIHFAMEMDPFAMVGGLGDVVKGLPLALSEHGQGTAVMLPLPRRLADQARKGSMVIEGQPLPVKKIGRFEVMNAVGQHLNDMDYDLFAVKYRGVKVYFIDFSGWDSKPPSDRVYFDGANGIAQSVRFSYCAVDAVDRLRSSAYGDFQLNPGVIHAHDYHTALSLAFAGNRDSLRSVGRVYSLHNGGAAYQGRVSQEESPRTFEWISRLGLPPELANFDSGGFTLNGQLVLAKAGIIMADYVLPVSPHYSREIKTDRPVHENETFGTGLEGFYREREWKFIGMLNGAPYDMQPPSQAPPDVVDHDKGWGGSVYEYTSFTSDSLADRLNNKQALRKKLGLDDSNPDAPLHFFNGRLTDQKGLAAIADAAREAIAHRESVVVIATPDSFENLKVKELLELASQNPTFLNVNTHFDVTSVPFVLAAADFVWIPSLWEPCGMLQFKGWNYGAVPIVSDVGGLHDTVVDPQEDPREANGFRTTSGESFASTVRRARSFRREETDGFKAMQVRGMAHLPRWRDRVDDFIQVYAAAQSLHTSTNQSRGSGLSKGTLTLILALIISVFLGLNLIEMWSGIGEHSLVLAGGLLGIRGDSPWMTISSLMGEIKRKRALDLWKMNQDNNSGHRQILGRFVSLDREALDGSLGAVPMDILSIDIASVRDQVEANRKRAKDARMELETVLGAWDLEGPEGFSMEKARSAGVGLAVSLRGVSFEDADKRVFQALLSLGEKGLSLEEWERRVEMFFSGFNEGFSSAGERVNAAIDSGRGLVVEISETILGGEPTARDHTRLTELKTLLSRKDEMKKGQLTWVLAGKDSDLSRIPSNLKGLLDIPAAIRYKSDIPLVNAKRSVKTLLMSIQNRQRVDELSPTDLFLFDREEWELESDLKNVASLLIALAGGLVIDATELTREGMKKIRYLLKNA